MNKQKYFIAAILTGSWYEDGSYEHGETCQHKHRSAEAADNCRWRNQFEGTTGMLHLATLDQDGFRQ